MPTYPRPLEDVLKRTDIVFAYLAMDPGTENPTPTTSEHRPDGYLHVTNDPARHIKRSARPKPVTFDSPTAATAALANAGFIPTMTEDLDSGKPNGCAAYRDTPAGKAAYQAFMDAVDAQADTLAKQKAHAEAVQERRAKIVETTKHGIPQHALAVAFGRQDAQVASMVRRPPSKLPASAKGVSAVKGSKKGAQAAKAA